MISDVIRRKISQKLTGEREIKFQNTIPDDYSIARNIHELDKIGLYLHIPFCNQICPYCPYNKEIFRDDMAKKYAKYLRQTGYLARVIKHPSVPGTYRVYIRRK